MVRNREQLTALIDDGLVQNMIDRETQVTPNGVDLTVGEIHRFTGPGQLDFSNDERELPETEPIQPEGDGEYGWWELEPGVYKIVTNEVVDIPDDLIGIAFQRSSLPRMGCHIENAYWDAGFTGRSEFLLCVQNPEGVRIKENARVNQLSFFEMDAVAEGYDGEYQEVEPAS